MPSLNSTPSLSRTPSVTFNLGGRTQVPATTAAIDDPTTDAAVLVGAPAAAAAVVAGVAKPTPFASLDAAQAVQQQQQDQAQPPAAGVRKEPELIGFVLLDPLWEEGQEVGYVSSIVRMRRNAHQGEHWGPGSGKGQHPVGFCCLRVCLHVCVCNKVSMSYLPSVGLSSKFFRASVQHLFTTVLCCAVSPY